MLQNRTPYATERNWVRDKQGVHHWLVAVKATFDIKENGALKLSDEQPPPLLEPEYRGAPITTSLRLDSDLLAVKPGTDVILDACAHAPGGRATGIVPVSLKVGSVQKTLLVHGVRVYYRGALGLTTSEPRPFVTSPILYEWAFGGNDTSHPDPRKHRVDLRNPIGKGIAADANHLEYQPAHAIEYPGVNPAKVGPAGFGPIASFWSPRLERAGTYDSRWEALKKPLLPDDYDERYALSSPDDQRPVAPLRGGETVSLVNMTSEGMLRFNLPRIYLVFRTHFGRRAEEHRATLTTVFVASEQRKLSLVWQSALQVAPRDVDYLDRTIIREKAYLT
ncbi:MAG TPA: DUF2169 domain-containing protein [Archangium sp.]|nr:DUF2169 domain-containing protein [Archangium sp.]